MDQGTTELTPQDVDITLEVIEDGIIDTEITAENAPMFGKRLLHYAILSYEGAQREHPTPEMADHIIFLKSTEVEAEEGKSENLSRFLRSEAQRRKTGLKDPKHTRDNALAAKLEQIAEIQSL